MPKIVITHSVGDIDNWLKGKSERAEAIGSMGGSNVVDHVANDGSNTIAISADMDDVDAALATMASPPPQDGGRHGEARGHPPLGGLRREVVIRRRRGSGWKMAVNPLVWSGAGTIG